MASTAAVGQALIALFSDFVGPEARTIVGSDPADQDELSILQRLSNGSPGWPYSYWKLNLWVYLAPQERTDAPRPTVSFKNGIARCGGRTPAARQLAVDDIYRPLGDAVSRRRERQHPP